MAERRAAARRPVVSFRRNRHQTIGWLLVCAGWAAGVGGWVGVQSTYDQALQLAYLASGGLAGIALVTMGIGLHATDDTRASREILEDLQDRLEDLEFNVDRLVDLLDRPESDPRAR